MNILFLDLETTGIEADNNHVIQIGAEFHQDGKKVSDFNQKLSPANKTGINLGALAVNKIKMRELFQQEGAEKIVHKFVDFLLECKEKSGKENLFVCGHNVYFDVKFIINLLSLHGIEGLDSILYRKHLDTSVLAQGLIAAGRITPEKDSLKGLAEYFDVVGLEEGQDALTGVTYHDAAYDTNITAKVYYKIIDLLKG